MRDFEVDSSNPEGEHVFLNKVTKTEYQYRFNGKEWQDELNLNLYDFHARNYDPTTGRTSTPDPMAEMFYSQSSYSFFNNNPVITIDPTGMIGEDWKQDNLGNYVYDANLTAENASTQLGEGETYLGESASFGVNDSNSGDQLGTMNLNADGSANFTTTDGQITEFNDMTVDMGFDSGHKIMAGNYQNGDLFSKGNFIAGAIGTGLEYTPGSFRFGTTKQGFSPKYYGNSWGGNQYAKTFNIGKLGRLAGYAGFFAGVGMDIYGLSNGTTSWGKAGVNTAVGAWGLTGFGAPASILYNAAEAFHPQGAAGAWGDHINRAYEFRQTNGFPLRIER